MNQYVIYMDMSGDLDEAFAREHDILFVPMMYTIGSQEKFCTSLEKEEDLKPFYAAQRKGIETRTSQVTPQQYIDIFQPWLEKGTDVLYLSLSSGLTKTFDSVRLAA
ncbi:MAG: DegV family protein, partial [Lachnospiraceae bacterium]|nr:DegV family protein [Lachnospiraceae bacterium]